MFYRDMPLLRSHALSSPAGLLDVIAFVLCTIQQPLQSVAKQMADIRANGAEARALFGSKRPGYVYARDHIEVLYAAVKRGAEVGDTVGTVDALLAIPGLGVVKASFVAQICGLEVACLDTHNLRALGLAETAFKLPKGLKPATRLAKVAAYVAVCAESGGSAFWWDRWCETVAGSKFNRSLPTADAVSAYHVACVVA